MNCLPGSAHRPLLGGTMECDQGVGIDQYAYEPACGIADPPDAVLNLFLLEDQHRDGCGGETRAQIETQDAVKRTDESD